MKKLLNIAYLFLGFLFIFLLVSLWLPNGNIIAGHDSGLALDAKGFLESRLSAWEPQGFGRDNSWSFGSITIHLIDFIFATLSRVPFAGNKLTVFFWLSSIFFAGFIFGYIFRKRLGKYSPYLLPVFLTFNLFNLQSIFILERAKYSLLISTIAVLAIILKLKYKEISLLTASVLASLILSLFNGGSWFAFPLYGGLFVMLATILMFDLTLAFRNGKFETLKRYLYFIGLTGLGYFALNSYSTIPFIASFLKGGAGKLVDSGVISQNHAWLDSLSAASSYINILRLQGIPDWYSGSFEINTQHAYSTSYFSNPYLIVASFMFPVLAFGSFLLIKSKKEKRLIAMLGLLALTSVFFMAGSHKPLGPVYEFFYDYIPGFAVFRSPFYKFGNTYFLSISILISFAISRAIETFFNSRRFHDLIIKPYLIALSIFLITAGWMAYHYPFFNPSLIFNWQNNLSTRLIPPGYTSEFRKWIDSQKIEGRVLLLPPLNSTWQDDAYSWGYWSLTAIPEVLIKTPTLSNNRDLTEEESRWMNAIYTSIKEENEEKTIELFHRLRISHILLRNDTLSDGSWSSSEPSEVFRKSLGKLGSIKKISEFGKWAVYQIDRNNRPEIDAFSSLALLSRTDSFLGREYLVNENFLFRDQSKDFQTNLPAISDDLLSYSCDTCLLERLPKSDQLPYVKILPNSPFYWIKTQKEKKIINSRPSDASTADALLGFVYSRAGEVKRMLSAQAESLYITSDLQKMASYLRKAKDILQTQTSPGNDYFRAAMVLDFSSPIEGNLREFISNDDFTASNFEIRKALMAFLWELKSLKDLYSPVYSNLDNLNKNKQYKIFVPESKESKFYLDKNSLARGMDKHPILPKISVYNPLGIVKNLSTQDEKNSRWLEIKSEEKLKGNYVLKLAYDTLPNLFFPLGSDQVELPLSKGGCLYGRIVNFDKNRRYFIKAKLSSEDQRVKLYFLETATSKKKDFFLHGDNEVDVSRPRSDDHPLLTFRPFRYIYYPGAAADDPTLYLCNDGDDLPKIDSFEIYEVTSPVIISDVRPEKLTQYMPDLSFQKLSDTKYKVSVHDAKEDFILRLDQAYGPFWVVSKNNAPVYGSSHFMIDGYANSWKVTDRGNFDLIIEYRLQQLFYLGSLVSILAALSAIVFLAVKTVLYFKIHKK